MATLDKSLSTCRLQEVCWALDPTTTPIEHMGIDHRRPDVLVPEQFLHGPNVVPRFE